LSGLHAVAIRRFDRTVGGGRIHSVSASTAIRAATAAGREPQLGYPELARLLRRAGVATDGANLQDARELFRRMVFNILMDNTDDHEKNHSLLVVAPFQHGRFRLAPAYDLLPTHSGQGYQEFICGKQGRDSTLDNAMSECDAFGLTPVEAAAEVVRVVDVVNTWKLHFAEAGVSPRDIESLAQQIDGEFLLRQRNGFEPERFVVGTGKRLRKSPFSGD
jgi:serine/threonine-protein kinase HipA